MTNKKELFENISTETSELKLASDQYTAQVKGKGIVQISVKNHICNLNDTLYVPELSVNLMSVGKITQRGNKVLFEKDKASIIEKNGKITLIARKLDGLYYIEMDQSKEVANITCGSDSDTMKWHKKMGHINEKDLRLMEKNELMRGLTLKNEKLEKCETCMKGKMSSLPFFPIDKIISNEPLQIVHSDVCGPFENESLAGSRYYVTFIDDYTRYCCIYFIKNKSEVLDKFKEYKNNVEKFLKTSIQSLQTDNGTEYRNRAFDEYLKDHGISRRLSAPYTPQQNGVSERKIGH